MAWTETALLLLLLLYDMDVSCHRPFLPGTSIEPAVIPHRSGFKLHTAVLSLLCVMFQVQLSFVVNLSNVFLVQLPNFSLGFSLLFQWLHYYYYYYYYYYYATIINHLPYFA